MQFYQHCLYQRGDEFLAKHVFIYILIQIMQIKRPTKSH